MESFQKCIDLLLNHSVHFIHPKPLKVIKFIFVGHFNVDSTFNQLPMLDLAEMIRVDTEVHLVVRDIILERPFVTSKRIIVQVVLIFKCKFVADHHLIQWLAEVALQ